MPVRGWKILLILLLGLGTLLPCRPAVAADKPTLVSIILTGNLSRYRLAQQAFVDRLNELPAIPNLQIYVQTPNPDLFSLANSVRKAVAIQSDLIIAYGAQAALAARNEAGRIPVLYADVYDPVALGLARCEEDVSCNLSGISAATPLQTLLKAFNAIAPDCKRIGMLYSSNDAGSVQQVEILEKLAAHLGVATRRYDVQHRAELGDDLNELAMANPALFLSDSDLLQQEAQQVMEFATAHDLLVFSQVPGLCDQGALLTLEPNPEEQGSRLGDYARAVLSGKAVRGLPVASPKKVDLVINLQVVHEKGLKVPFDTLSLATRVVK